MSSSSSSSPTLSAPAPTAPLINRRGMSDVVINELLVMANVSDRYRGSYLADNLPQDMARDVQEFIIIINIGLHFVTLHATKKYIFYVDSMGRPILLPQILKFISLRPGKPAVYYNKSRVQSPLSSHCGLYAALFVLCLDGVDKHTRKRVRRRGRRAVSATETLHILPMQFFKRGDLNRNDKLCVKYLKKIIRFHDN